MSYEITNAASGARGLDARDSALVHALVALWSEKRGRNDLRDKYYLGHIGAKGLGISIAPEMKGKVNARIDWPAKAVDYLAARSQFDGYTSSDDQMQIDLGDIAQANRMKDLYRKAVICELRHGCAALAVTAGDGHPVVSAYPMTACALLWDDANKEVSAGLVVSKSVKKPGSDDREPIEFKLFTRDALVIVAKDQGGYGWNASYAEHSMGRPLIEPMAYRPTLERPFGRSRITRAVMSITDDAQREKERSEIAAEFAAYPQKYLLNTDDKKIPKGKNYAAYIGALLEVTKGEGGTPVTFGQLPQLSMQPHIDYMRSLAAQFSCATNVPLSSLGVVSDNPSSAEAIYAAKEDMVIDAQALNIGNGYALANVAMMALASSYGTDFASVRDSGFAVEARFRSPAMPSVVSQSAAMVQQISAIPWLADSSVVLEELGYTEEQIARLQSDRRKSQANSAVASLLSPGEAEKHVESAPQKDDPSQSAEVSGKTLNGAQTQSLIAIMAQFTGGSITEGQAVNLISTSIGVSKQDARDILNGKID